MKTDCSQRGERRSRFSNGLLRGWFRRMAEPHVLTGLIAKRAEIAGQIEHTQDQLRQLVIDLDHIDAAIHIFDPSIELEEIKSRPVPAAHQAFRGQVTRIVLTIYGDEKKGVSTWETPKVPRPPGGRHGAARLRHHRREAPMTRQKTSSGQFA
jgi:hypothetical protein